MTFIASIKTTQGIVFAADTKELIRGGQLLWTDFEKIINAKSLDVDSKTLSISPSEIKELFRKTAQENEGRIKSTDTGQKLFKVSSRFCIVTAGLANPGGKEFADIVLDIEKKLTDPNAGFKECLQATYDVLLPLYDANNPDETKSEIIFGGIDEEDDTFAMKKLWFADQRIMENGKAVLDERNMPKNRKVFTVSERPGPLVTGGWTNYLRELSEFNMDPPELQLIDGFRLLEQIMKLAVLIEELKHIITGIGGRISYAVITNKGFSRVETGADVLNLIL